MDPLKRVAPPCLNENDLALTMDSLFVPFMLFACWTLFLILPTSTTDEIDVLITALQSKSISEEERALGAFARRKLKTLPTWSLWSLVEKKQLDQFESLGMHEKPCRPPKGAIVLCSHWQHRVKTSGEHRSR
jgi:hypothetical protein